MLINVLAGKYMLHDIVHVLVAIILALTILIRAPPIINWIKFSSD